MTEREEPEPTRPVDLGDATQPVDVTAETGPFARSTPPSQPVALVSSTAANMLLADALPPTTAPEPAVPDPTSGLDSLFGDSQFRVYDEPTAHAAPAPGTIVVEEPPHMTPAHRVLLGVAGGLVALVALGALFFLGTRIAGMTPVATAAPTPAQHRTPTPAPTVLPPGPVADGAHRWDRLLGGECLSSFPGPWAQQYTVVGCATPHAAQLVLRAWYPDAATPGYPGAEAIAAQMSVLCSKPGVIDLAAASAYTDAQIEASYPATARQWDAGDHWYYCFVTRSSKQPLTGSVAAARPSASPAP